MAFIRNWLFKLQLRVKNRCCIFGDVQIKNPKNIRIGKNSKLLRGCTLIATQGKINIGNRVHLNRMVLINAEKAEAEITLEDGVEINDGSLILARGNITVRRDAIIGPGVKLISYQHTFADIELPIKAQNCINGNIEIGEGAWIGANAVIMSNVRIGKGCVIGAGAIVNRNIPDYAIAVGCPAHVIKNRMAYKTSPKLLDRGLLESPEPSKPKSEAQAE